MEKAFVEVPENQKELFQELLTWEPAQMKKELEKLIFFFAMYQLNDENVENCGIEVAFCPRDLQNLLLRLKCIADSIN
jgi:hypothetical protein